MNAVYVGRSKKYGDLYKCPVCGLIQDGEPWKCPNCDQTLETYQADSFTVVENPKVCVDLHGVCLDMCGALQKYFAAEGVAFFPERVTDYDFNCDTGVPASRVYSAFKNDSLYDLIEPYPMVDEAMYLLRQHCSPRVYSTGVDDYKIMYATNKFVQQFGLKGQLLTGKKPVIFDANVVFDDCPGVIKQFVEAKFKGLLYVIDRPYNQPKATDFFWGRTIRVKSLYEGVVDMYKRFGWPLEVT